MDRLRRAVNGSTFNQSAVRQTSNASQSAVGCANKCRSTETEGDANDSGKFYF